jgi:hypothetical protein
MQEGHSLRLHQNAHQRRYQRLHQRPNQQPLSRLCRPQQLRLLRLCHSEKVVTACTNILTEATDNWNFCQIR